MEHGAHFSSEIAEKAAKKQQYQKHIRYELIFNQFMLDLETAADQVDVVKALKTQTSK